jgi:hypothetical protein
MLLLPLQALASGLLACEQHQMSQVSQRQQDSHVMTAATPDCHGQSVQRVSSTDERSSTPAPELECRHCINTCQTKLGLDDSNSDRLAAYMSDNSLNSGVSVTLPGFNNLPQRPPCF